MRPSNFALILNATIRIVFVVVFALVLVPGCENAKELRSKELEGINGKAVYRYKGDSLKFVYKEQYFTDTYNIMLHHDTVRLGETFRCHFLFRTRSGKIFIKEPQQQLIENTQKRSYTYTFTPQRKGIYDFNGFVELNDTKIPFEYRFIVY
jgi:hypothetical protein